MYPIRYPKYRKIAATAALGASTLGSAVSPLTNMYRYMTSSSKKAMPTGKVASRAIKAMRKPKPKKRKMIRPTKLVKEVTKLSNKVNTLSKESKAQLSVLEYHNRTSGRILTSVNQSNFFAVSGNTVVNYEAVLGQLRFFNPATPGTLTTADGSTGTYAREYYFKSIYARLDCYNNYQVPVIARVYCLVPKTDTSNAPETSVSNGLADVGSPSFNSPVIYPSDSQEFQDTWTIKYTKLVILKPGAKVTATWSAKDVYYAPQIYDSITSTYQKRFKCQAFAIRVEGVLGHDTSANQQSLLSAGLDYVSHYKWVVHYDNGGTPIRYIYVNDTCPTSFTNSGVVSEQPIADNISYSVS